MQTETRFKSHSLSQHSQSEKLISNTLAQTQKNFRRRSVKMRNINFYQDRTAYETPAYQIQETNTDHYELKFLSEIIRKKNTQLTVSIPEEASSPKKPGKDYEYYDMIVRDLISQIRERSTRESTISPPGLKMSKKGQTYRVSPHKRGESEYGSIKLSGLKEKMVFSLSLSGSDTVYERKITTYIEFLYKLNFANRMYVDLSLSKPKTVYRVRVGPGNNAILVKSLLSRRFWLQLSNNPTDCHFEWTQQTNAQLHESQPSSGVSSGEQRTRLKPTNRMKLLPNTPQQFQLRIMVREQVAVSNEWYERSDCGKLSCFKETPVGQVSNHIPLNCIIGAKRILFKVIHWHYSHILQLDPFTVLPKTYTFENADSIRAFTETHKNSRRVWIVKPGENTNRGNGIKIVQTEDLMNLLGRQRSRGPEVRPLIVQQYIKPFLYNGRKFDIRHYLLVTSHNGIIRGYWYRQGYIRTSSEKYDIEDMDQMIHLTNDAVQKRGDRYGKYQPANKLSYSQFQRYLDTSLPHKHYNFEAQILLKMKEITTQMLRAAFQFMDPMRRQHNFEFYGLDFYISSKFKPFLIECNANPCLEINCPILQRIIPGAVEHALRIGLDPLFPPPQHYPPAARYSLCDRVLQKLKYELIFDEKVEGAALREKAKTCANKLDLSGIRLRPQEDQFEDEGEQLGEEAPLD